MNKKITRNFNLLEFQSKDGSIMPEYILNNVIETAKNLQVLRSYIGFPIHINSGYRSVEHNRNIGGVENSKHLKGIAVDITCKHINSRKLYKIIISLINKGKLKQGGVGLYSGFVHYDIRGYSARWKKIKWYENF